MSGDRPDARELVEAVAAWLAEDLTPELTGGARFQALVAAQGLAIAARELAVCAEHEAADAAALAAVVPGHPRDAGGARRALASALRSGQLDGDLAVVADVLREHVCRKLAIARPGYEAG